MYSLPNIITNINVWNKNNAKYVKIWLWQPVLSKFEKNGKTKKLGKKCFFFYVLQIVFFGPIGHIFQPPRLFST